MKTTRMVLLLMALLANGIMLIVIRSWLPSPSTADQAQRAIIST